MRLVEFCTFLKWRGKNVQQKINLPWFENSKNNYLLGFLLNRVHCIYIHKITRCVNDGIARGKVIQENYQELSRIWWICQNVNDYYCHIIITI